MTTDVHVSSLTEDSMLGYFCENCHQAWPCPSARLTEMRLVMATAAREAFARWWGVDEDDTANGVGPDSVWDEVARAAVHAYHEYKYGSAR